MNFTHLIFLIFFPVLLLILFITKNNRTKKIFILVASYLFYGYWDYRFLSLIIISTLTDYIAGRKIYLAGYERKIRKKWLLISIVINLGILGFFKYFNFFIDSANLAFSWLSINLNTLNIILPVGISFYTFQTLSYTIDIYRKKLKPTNQLLDFAIFVSFFPQLIAGPIVRAIEFLPQLKNEIKIRRENIEIGLQIFLFGMIKKVLFADRLAIFVDQIFKDPGIYDSLTIWLAVIAYSIQIYCDFSGYSDMAIGSAKMMGFNLPINFNLPYISKNITEFWRRWHISLSSWLKDYLYISLGGNRKGKIRTYLNLMITMLLGGLWHGASWNFVFWGFLHGLGLSIHKKYLSVKSKSKHKNSIIVSYISWLITYLFVLVCWVFFRSNNFNNSILMIKKMFLFVPGVTWIFTPLLIIGIFTIHGHIMALIKKRAFYPIFKLNSFTGAFMLIITILSIYFFRPISSNPFIYFQF